MNRFVHTQVRAPAGRGNGRSRAALHALLSQLFYKDPGTLDHTSRCAAYAGLLGRELGFAEPGLRLLQMAALLHDIGKVGVPDEILLKPGSLSEEESRIMRAHPVIGAELLREARALAEVVPVVLHHHERFDGQGYPAGLAGDRIPLASRILLVTDAFDAMITDRPYRKALSVEEAVDELRRNSGTQFDPDIVRAFLRCAPAAVSGFRRNRSK